MRVLYGAVLEPPERRSQRVVSLGQNGSGGYFETVSPCLSLNDRRCACPSNIRPELICRRGSRLADKVCIQVVITFQEVLCENFHGLLAVHEHVHLPGELK